MRRGTAGRVFKPRVRRPIRREWKPKTKTQMQRLLPKEPVLSNQGLGPLNILQKALKTKINWPPCWSGWTAAPMISKR